MRSEAHSTQLMCQETGRSNVVFVMVAGAVLCCQGAGVPNWDSGQYLESDTATT
jgi:hypothetical protein